VNCLLSVNAVARRLCRELRRKRARVVEKVEPLSSFMEAASTAPRETHCTQLSRNSRPSMSYREGEDKKSSLCEGFSVGGTGLEL